METPSAACKSKSKLLKMLPKAASSISFDNLPFSPNRIIKNKKKNKKVAKEKKIEESLYGPASPKISCMGQIKHRKKQAQNMHIYLQKEVCPFSSPQIYCSKNKSSSVIKPMFFLSEAEKIPSNMRNNNGRKSDASSVSRPVCLNQMKRFASCRGGALTNYDWKIARMELDHLDQYFEEWKNDYQVDEEEEEEVVGVNEVAITAAPMAVVGSGGDGDDDQELQPREEINIWQRRTITKPPTLNIQRCH